MPQPPKPHKAPEPPHHKMGDESRREDVLVLNTEENAHRAIATAQTAVSDLEAGNVFLKREPRGELIVKGVLSFNGMPVAALRFNPASGALMPKGLHPLPCDAPDSLEKFRAELGILVKSVKVMPGAEFREPEFCWAVPLVHSGRIVADIKISGSGDQVIEDRKLVEELRQQ